MAWNLAMDRPLFGGGFGIYNAAVFNQYAPIPTDIHAAHSIYFQVLGEHGFVGLFPVHARMVAYLANGVWIRKNTTPKGDGAWAYHLAAMSQVSLVGFFVGGAFLSLAYFDLPYYIMVALVATKWILERERKSSQDDRSSAFASKLRRHRRATSAERRLAHRDMARDRPFSANDRLHAAADRRIPVPERMFRWTLSVADRRPGLSILLFHRVLAGRRSFRTGDMTAAQFEAVVTNLARNLFRAAP